LAFDNKRQVQCMAFVIQKPATPTPTVWRCFHFTLASVFWAFRTHLPKF
jgi:hypothetical protein